MNKQEEELDLDEGSDAEDGGQTKKEDGEDRTHDDDVHDTSEKSRNKSNWKEMSDSLKKERTERAQLSQKNTELSQKNTELETELEAWRSQNADIVKEAIASRKNESTSFLKELTIFIASNPEAKGHIDEIEKQAKEHNMSLEKAWNKLVKPDVQESISKTDFSVSGKPKTKKIEDMTMEEAYSTLKNKNDLKKWRDAHPEQ